MSASGIALSELERDALTELANIGVSRAAANLRKMAGEQVLLSVPSVEVVTRTTAAALIGERESDKLIAVRQDFSGAFSGRALLIFPQANSLELLRAVLGGDIGADELATLEEEALAETGNIILNGCLATIANILQQSLSMSLPEVVHGDGAHLFEVVLPPGIDGLVLFLYINFSVRDRDIRGYIAMLMDLPSLESLRLLINEFIASVMDEDGAGGA
jgi:chemotaxis protein CheC